MFLLVGAVLTDAQGFKNLAFAICPMVFAGRLLAQEFELAEIGLKFMAEAIEVLAEHGSELKFGGGASGGEPGRVGLRRAGEEAFQLCQSFLGAQDLEIRLLQLQRALALDALTEAEQRGESETECHASVVPIQKSIFRPGAP